MTGSSAEWTSFRLAARYEIRLHVNDDGRNMVHAAALLCCHSICQERFCDLPPDRTDELRDFSQHTLTVIQDEVFPVYCMTHKNSNCSLRMVEQGVGEGAVCEERTVKGGWHTYEDSQREKNDVQAVECGRHHGAVHAVRVPLRLICDTSTNCRVSLAVTVERSVDNKGLWAQT